MIDDQLNKNSFLTIKEALEIDINQEINLNEEDMILEIERRVAEMIEKDMPLLLSYLYRLDISESKINACLNPASPFHPYSCLATLIWERQKQRITTKLYYKNKDTTEDGWEW